MSQKNLFYFSKQKWTFGDILLIKELPFQYQHVLALLDIIISIDPLIREAWTRREVWTCIKDLENGHWRGSNGILSLLLFKGNLPPTSPRPEISISIINCSYKPSVLRCACVSACEWNLIIDESIENNYFYILFLDIIS